MRNGKVPPTPAADCKDPLQQNVGLGRKLDVSGTPTLLFTDGRRMPGAMPLERIEAAFKEIAAR
jgi:thiol:disulfide interchange protein DsbC